MSRAGLLQKQRGWLKRSFGVRSKSLTSVIMM
jgi:hypothetical protein